MNDPKVSVGRWVLAPLVGLATWALTSTLTTGPFMQVFGNLPVGLLLGAFLGVIVAGRIVGARSPRQWITIGVLTVGLIVITTVAFVVAFLRTFS
ncbi:MAG: hypothetical protein A2V84_01885 [Chloroflexi bacterium RBG_16_70_13]|nr:MAG: hypothetical protein A2V84_01885 [Chloroflexi bacterium RBG_16_70_13]